MARTSEEYRFEGIASLGGARALCEAAAKMLNGAFYCDSPSLDGDVSAEEAAAELMHISHLLCRAGEKADHAALMFRLSKSGKRDPEPDPG